MNWLDRLFREGSNRFYTLLPFAPDKDAKHDIGQSDARYKDLYLSGVAHILNRVLLTPADSGTDNQWGIDDSDGVLRFFRENYSTGASGATRMQITDAGVVTAFNGLVPVGIGTYHGLTGSIAHGDVNTIVANLPAGLYQVIANGNPTNDTNQNWYVVGWVKTTGAAITVLATTISSNAAIASSGAALQIQNTNASYSMDFYWSVMKYGF